MKKLKKALIVVAALAIAGLAAKFAVELIVKSRVAQVGSKVMGVPVKLGDVSLSPFKDRVHFANLVIGNPAEFKTDYAIKLDKGLLEYVPRSLLSGRFIIRNITVVSLTIMYEQTLSGNNLSKIRKNLKGAQRERNNLAEETAESGQKPQTKVEIDKIMINGGMIRMTAPRTGSAPMHIPLLRTIQLADIGKDQEGASVEAVAAQVFSAIFDGVTNAVSIVGDVMGKGADGIDKSAAEGAQAAGETATDAGQQAGDAAAGGFEGGQGLPGGK